MAHAAQNTNRAPSCRWFSTEMPCGTVRSRLYVDGRESRYFIDSAKKIGHRTMGDDHGLFGSGMSPRGCALTLGSASKITVLKHRAEQMALNA